MTKRTRLLTVVGALFAAYGFCAQAADDRAVVDASPHLDPTAADCGLQRAIDAAGPSV